MPKMAGMVVGYLSPSSVSSSWRKPTLPCRVTSAYATAGQADTSLHTMAVLQVYQADLLRILDHGKGLRPDKVQELCQNLTGIKEKDKAFSSTLQFHLLVCLMT